MNFALLLFTPLLVANGKIVLLTQLHDEANQQRLAEIKKAFTLNQNNVYIDEIHLLQHDNVPFAQIKSKKVHIQQTANKRLSFKEAISYANRHLLGDTVIIANNDISFDRSARHLHHPVVNKMLTSEYHCFCLSRHESNPNNSAIGTQCGPKYMGSHDAFIFSPPLPISLQSRLPKDDVYLGQTGADARFIYEARRAGLLVSNPCQTVRVWHHHKSGVRSAQPGREANLGGKSDLSFPGHLDLPYLDGDL